MLIKGVLAGIGILILSIRKSWVNTVEKYYFWLLKNNYAWVCKQQTDDKNQIIRD